MERNYGTELDSLKSEISEMKKLLCSLAKEKEIQDAASTEPSKPEVMKKPDERIACIKNMHPDKFLSEKMADLCIKTEKRGCTGLITYLGVFASGDRQSNWIRNEINTDDLLALIENHTAEKVLASLGNNDRLNILLAILRKPMTVAELVESCGFNTTGQVYHHLKSLLAADLIVEDAHYKGVYTTQPHKVQGIIMLLAGICDIMDDTYTTGDWKNA